MDIRCRHCGEPWDNDSLHEEVAERRALGYPQSSFALRTWPMNAGREVTYTMVASEFRRYGCGALVAFTTGAPAVIDDLGRFVLKPCPDGSANQGQSATLGAIYELMGDDMDGAASMIEDAEYLNLL